MGGEFPQASDGDIMKRLRGILTLSSKTNDYKFALARFLLDYSEDNSDPKVEYDMIAGKVLRTYWDQTGLRHSRNRPDRVPAITRIMEGRLGDSYRPSIDDIEEKDPKKIRRCTEEIIAKCFYYVVPRFQNVESAGGDGDIIFKWKPKGRISYRQMKGDRIPLDKEYGILLNPDAIRVMKKNHRELSCILTREWAKFLEGINLGVPNILRKVEGGRERKDLKEERRILSEHFGLECFYCRKKFGDISEMDADHVLPFRYMGEDELWNLVLAGRGCNGSKSALLPRERHIDRLKDRNECSRSDIPELDRSVRRLGDDMDSITRHYRIAIDSGLGTWDGRANCRVLETGAWRRRGMMPAPPAAARPA